MSLLCNSFFPSGCFTSSVKLPHVRNPFKPAIHYPGRAINNSIEQCNGRSVHSAPEFQLKLGELSELLVKAEARDPMESLLIVDVIQRLGFNNHFQQEVHQILSRHYSIIIAKMCDDHGSSFSLHHASLSFRVLRQQGFLISPEDVFNSFKGEDGKFRTELRHDIKGLLQLYEAAHLSFEGEDILDEAKEFSNNVLSEYCSSAHATQEWCNEIRLRLRHPYHKTITGLTRMDNVGISPCTQRNALTELVQANFRAKQYIYRDELLQVLRWWNSLGLVRELKIARNQPVKWYTWSMTALINHIGLSMPRVQLTKSLAFIYLIDDIFDLYGTLDELVAFTKALEIWDYTMIDMLPGYMKMCYKALLNTTHEISNEIHTMVNLCNAFLVEARWLAKNDLPGPQEYMDNAKVSSGVHVALVHLFFLLNLGKCHKSEIHLEDVSILISSVASILRLWDDLGSAKDEHQDGRDGSYITCYMNYYPHASVEQVQQHVSDQIEIEWKRLNWECFKLYNSKGSLFAEASLNVTRIVSAMYSYDDNQRFLEDYIEFMLNSQMFSSA